MVRRWRTEFQVAGSFDAQVAGTLFLRLRPDPLRRELDKGILEEADFGTGTRGNRETKGSET